VDFHSSRESWTALSRAPSPNPGGPPGTLPDHAICHPLRHRPVRRLRICFLSVPAKSRPSAFSRCLQCSASCCVQQPPLVPPVPTALPTSRAPRPRLSRNRLTGPLAPHGAAPPTPVLPATHATPFFRCTAAHCLLRPRRYFFTPPPLRGTPLRRSSRRPQGSRLVSFARLPAPSAGTPSLGGPNQPLEPPGRVRGQRGLRAAFAA
jgi:hypothetical protein